MIVKRHLGISDPHLPTAERERMKDVLMKRTLTVKGVKPQRPRRVNIVGSSEGPIAEVEFPDGKGGITTYVGRYDALVPEP